MKKTLKQAIIGGLILITAFIILYPLLKQNLAVFQPYAEPNQVIPVQGELYVKIDTGSFPLQPTHLQWQWYDFNTEEVVKSGIVQLPQSVITCLNQKITDTVSKLCTFNFDVTTPSSKGEYLFDAIVYSGSTSLTPYIREYEFTRKLIVTSSVGNCKADYIKTTQTIINNGIINKVETIQVDQNSCSESVIDTKYIVNCNQGYVQESSGSNSICKLPGSQCTSDWQCGDWNECSNGFQTRVCQDLNGCSLPTNVPEQTQTCTVVNQCGDGVCNSNIGETIQNCVVDCKEDEDDNEDTKFDLKQWVNEHQNELLISSIALVMIIIISAFYFTQRKK